MGQMFHFDEEKIEAKHKATAPPVREITCSQSGHSTFMVFFDVYQPLTYFNKAAVR